MPIPARSSSGSQKARLADGRASGRRTVRDQPAGARERAGEAGRGREQPHGASGRRDIRRGRDVLLEGYQLTGNTLFDGLPSLLIGAVLAVALGFGSVGLLTGESATPAVRQGLLAAIESFAGVDEVAALQSMRFGPAQLLVAAHLDFGRHLSSGQVEPLSTAIKQHLRERSPRPHISSIRHRAPSMFPGPARRVTEPGFGPGRAGKSIYLVIRHDWRRVTSGCLGITGLIAIAS